MSLATKVFDDVCEFAEHLRRLRAKRVASKLSVRTAGLTRLALSPKQREAVLKKTAGRCHVCGGSIEDTWCADHVFAHSHGGLHTEVTICQLMTSATIIGGSMEAKNFSGS